VTPIGVKNREKAAPFGAAFPKKDKV